MARGYAAVGYPGRVSTKRVPGGVVHKLPADLRTALIANSTALAAWKDITPLARNEFICWVEDAKQAGDPSATNSPHPRGTGRRPAPTVLLAGLQAPRAHRQIIALGAVVVILSPPMIFVEIPAGAVDTDIIGGVHSVGGHLPPNRNRSAGKEWNTDWRRRRRKRWRRRPPSHRTGRWRWRTPRVRAGDTRAKSSRGNCHTPA